MSEETQETNDGTWSGLKKTIIATLTTLITAGGAYLGSTLFNGQSDSNETKTEQVAPAAPAAAPITINVQQQQENTQKQAPATIIKERIIEKPVKEEKKKEEPKEEEAPW